MKTGVFFSYIIWGKAVSENREDVVMFLTRNIQEQPLGMESAVKDQSFLEKFEQQPKNNNNKALCWIAFITQS